MSDVTNDIVEILTSHSKHIEMLINKIFELEERIAILEDSDDHK